MDHTSTEAGLDAPEYSVPTIRPATRRAVVAVILDTPDARLQSVRDFFGDVPQDHAQALALAAFDRSPVKFTIEHEGDGLLAAVAIGPTGCLSVLFTEAARRHRKWIAQHGQRLLNEHREGQQKITADIPADDECLAGVLRSCGFEPRLTFSAPASGTPYTHWST